VSELLKLDTTGNLRDYIPGHPGRSRNSAHRAIGHTLHEKSDRFFQLSSGITVSATDIEIDDKKKKVTVVNESIINGAQTQGEFEFYIKELKEQGEEPEKFHARVEFMVDSDKNSSLMPQLLAIHLPMLRSCL
tara:strand:- start:359 stop:757 length:399 start_codon:yes stop_codon:yes gene_type:complete